MEWHWPQIVFCVGLAMRTSVLIRQEAKSADPGASVIAILLITAAVVYVLHAGGFW